MVMPSALFSYIKCSMAPVGRSGAVSSVSLCSPSPQAARRESRVVKDGVIKIAKKSGVPIVPVVWYSPNPTFLKFPSWDEFRIPLLWTHLVNVYGDPIYVDENNDKDQDEEIRLKLQKALLKLEERAPEEHKKVFRFGIWKR